MGQDIPKSIMVIGNDSHFSYLMRRYVKESAHPLVFSSLDENVLATILKENPLLIVLEIGLPETMGWHVLQKIKSHPAVCHTPVILCSWQDDRERGYKEGAEVYLQMPILYGDFLAALAAVGVKNGA
ncbi:MAG TPA: response regulator [Anaerolineaceae bacterium]